MLKQDEAMSIYDKLVHNIPVTQKERDALDEYAFNRFKPTNITQDEQQ